MKLRKLAAVLIPALVLATGTAACGGDDDDSSTSSSGKKLDKVTLMLNWYPYGEHAPFYYGKKQGIYEKHGIDLQINAGQGSQKTVAATGAGQTDFGWADTPAVLAGVGQGLPVKSLGVYLQTTPASVQFFADKGYKKPADIKGAKIAGTAGDALSRTFPVFLQKNGMTEKDVQIQNTDPAGKMSAVISGQADALLGYASDQGPTMANKANKEVGYLRYSDFGLNFYSNGLIAGQKTLGKQDLVKRMVAATTESWSAAQQNQAAAVASMAGASQQLPPETVLTEQFKTTLTLLHTPNTQGKAPGVNTEADWKQTIDIFLQAGSIKEAKPVSDYWQQDLAPQG